MQVKDIGCECPGFPLLGMGRVNVARRPVPPPALNWGELTAGEELLKVASSLEAENPKGGEGGY